MHEVFLMEYSYLQYTFYTLLYTKLVTYTQILRNTCTHLNQLTQIGEVSGRSAVYDLCSLHSLILYIVFVFMVNLCDNY